MTAKHLSVIVIAFGLTGCTGAVRPSLEEVASDVSARIDKRVIWNQDGAEDAAVAAEIEALLGAGLTSEAAVQIALLNNRGLQALYEDLGIAQANLVQAGLLSNPVFSAAAFFPVVDDHTDLDFGVTRSFLSVLYRPLRQRIAAAQFEAVKRRVTARILDFAADARATFYRLAAEEQTRELLEQVVAAAEASAEAARGLREAGNFTELDALREGLLAEEARLSLAAARARAIALRERLNALMGVSSPRSEQWRIEPRLPQIPEAGIEAADPEARAIAASLELEAYRFDIESAAERLGLADATALIPDLEAGVVSEHEEQRWALGPRVELQIPLFDQGQARRAAARSELRRLRQAYAAAAVEIRAATRAAVDELAVARHRAQRAHTALLPLASRLTAEAQLQYNAGQIGVFELLQAKRQQIDAGVRYIEALRDYWLARIRLEQILAGRVAAASGSDNPPVDGIPPTGVGGDAS
jgi:cobalt-zinc-cadmium efflux system outer membrane protein